MAKDFLDYQISDVEILGMEMQQVPIPKKLQPYEEQPFKTYRLLIRYHSKSQHHRECVGRCILVLKTQLKDDGGLFLVQGNILFKPYCHRERPSFNFVPKTRIFCSVLNSFLQDFVTAGRSLGEKFFRPEVFGAIKSKLFSCNLETVPMIYGYNNDGTLDKVAVNMQLFKPVNS
ncbi:MAG: hypothetical protein J6Y91_00120 [Alphaproteobacteria bacterium]|nr:hypothetical protein [Alphaproteobacteria bacterium]